MLKINESESDTKHCGIILMNPNINSLADINFLSSHSVYITAFIEANKKNIYISLNLKTRPYYTV